MSPTTPPNEALADLPDGVVVLDAAGRVAYMNAAAERLSGWTAGDAAGRHYGDVFALRDAAGILVHEKHDPYRTTLSITRESPEREYMLTRRDGEERWVALRAAYQRDASGAIRCLIASLRDIARRRRLEAHRADLISTVSHEIRSPLTSVKGFTSTLLRKWDSFNDEQKFTMLKMINVDADRVTVLLTDLLDVSRLEAGRLELKRQEIEVPAIAERVVTRARGHADRHELHASFPAAFPVITADPGKVEQVMVNLVENAIKYADPGMITVSGEVRDSEIVVRVADSGPGIDARHVPHIFTKFYRRGAGERHAGTGLGLYISKGIVEAHGGSIQVEKSGPSGTVFAFTLPSAE